ncbi:MAG: flagellar biosynthetic protein FliQ [Gemmatimonadetes bacterium]|nr:flagellar biosynthetic protein FliQ [Gemmatimonadota bacterium]
MTEEYVISLARQSLLLTLFLASPMLVLGLAVGVAISVFQAVTQIHEMTLTFIPKILAVVGALIVFLPWMISLIVGYTTELFESIPGLVS